ncbi:predicted protein [Aspergillus nidulans FGSC A4]|uniref:Uncharacterized protein n=1 Tax=Emericella nidulans (strain FGSC A4 / ATCC 38163 / CBS 112.46 / NRRL 194 / M139) TaxID=227321 RepID=Q5B1S8_EMENI|nr:hypothetical protein [Aspergillus nidulans FGSC A4]EAA62662.1 predicted protein [Aspergillus nidulans FGSC A4]CBF81787.1 TPA: conserved hypothetical protein [Aspergillus nidulans FGSC A4]|eukprot:XP_663106.1 predicted protein [Aspergillus nidulans FGSC A4]
MNAIQIPSPVQLGHTNIDGEETPSSVDIYSWPDNIQELDVTGWLSCVGRRHLSFFRPSSPALPLSNTNPIPVPLGGQDVPMKPVPSHQPICRRPARGRSRSLTAERTNAQATEGIHRHRSVSPWTVELTDVRKISHTNRKREIQEVLGPLFAGGTNNLVLLCWGDRDRCHIIPTDVRNEADEVNVWESIKTAWYSRRDYEFAIPGAKTKAHFVGLYRDLTSERSKLEGDIANYEEKEFPCPYDSSTGMVDCFRDICISYMDDTQLCPERRLYNSQRQLLRLTRRPLLTQAFSNRNVAKVNNLLQGERLIYSQLDILKKLDEWHVPDLSEIPFHALLITEGWDYDIRNVVIPLTASFFFTLVVMRISEYQAVLGYA